MRFLSLVNWLLPVLLVLHFTCNLQAQDYRVFARRYGVMQGLPHRQVNSLIQDRRGVIWVATEAGVVRFDGHIFKTFNKTENGLSTDQVKCLLEDAAGYIWAISGTSAGIASLDVIEPVSGKIIPAADYFKQPLPIPLDHLYIPFPLSDFPGQQEARKGSIFLGTSNPAGWASWNPETGWQVVPIKLEGSFRPILVAPGPVLMGDYKSAADNSLCTIDCQGNFSLLPEFPHSINLGESGDPTSFLYYHRFKDKIAEVWAMNASGKITHQTDLSAALLKRIPDAFINLYAELEGGEIHLKNDLVTDKNDAVLLDLKQEYPDIKGTPVTCYLRDKRNPHRVWIGTSFGLILLDIRKDHFRRLISDPKATGGRGLACRGLLVRNDTLVVNLESRDGSLGRTIVDLHSGARLSNQPGFNLGLAAASDGTIWTNHAVNGDIFLGKMNLHTGQVAAVAPVNLKIWSIFQQNAEQVLIGLEEGLFSYDLKSRQLSSLANNQFPELAAANVVHIGSDASGKIWACTNKGLYRIEPGKGGVERYWSGGKGKFALPYDNLFHFYEDKDGIRWIGTGGGGLIRWDTLTGVKKILFRNSGLLNGFVYAVYEDDHEHLWLPTDYGIVQFDKKLLQVRRTWLPSDGVAQEEFNRISHARGPDGTLYFGGLNGVTAFHPKDFYASAPSGNGIYPLVVSDLRIFNGDTGQLENCTAALMSNNQITVTPSDRYVQLEFAMLDYATPDKVTYSWKIEGIDQDWLTVLEPLLRLSSLPYGAHHLRIRARAADGTWAENELDLNLKVLPPFYLRWWFVLGMILVIAAGIRMWLNWRNRTHRLEQERLETEVERQTATIRRQSEALKKLDEAKSRFFANVSHELRTPLTLVLGPLSTMLKRNKLEHEDRMHAGLAQTHGKQLLFLVNEMLALSKLESGKMELHETPVLLLPFVKRMIGGFESHAGRLGIQLTFAYESDTDLVVLADAEKIQKVVNNLLSNALKFTPKGGKVDFRVEVNESSLQFIVRDTGRGIHPDDLPHVFERFFQTTRTDAPIEGGTGIGLALCREYAELMQGRIWVESTFGEGSVFCFEFPKRIAAVPAAVPVIFEKETIGIIPKPQTEAVLNPKNQPVILLVEDNESLRDYARLVLSAKYHVRTAENGQAAIEILRETRHQPAPQIDLILSDVMMPVMDGFQLLERLKQDDQWRRIPVIMLTARAELQDKLRALRIGVDDYLLKPFEEEELMARVGNLLRHALERTELQSVQPPSGKKAEGLEWLELLEQRVLKVAGDSRLSPTRVARDMEMELASFSSKLKSRTGLSPEDYIREVRLNLARRLLETRSCTSENEAALKAGFGDTGQFADQFKRRFGKAPVDYF
jgi:signal transduction histidine kinase/DNA-binding response OmpR family regulator/ligand-binding sensor domain-containing protein